MPTPWLQLSGMGRIEEQASGWAAEGSCWPSQPQSPGVTTLTSHSTVSRWDPSQEDWEAMAPLCQARSFFPLVALDGLLYALGGRNGDVALDSVEAYNPELNVWR